MVDVVVRLDEEGRYSWSRIESRYDTDVLIGRSYYFDNGLETHTEYSNGVRTRTIQLDNPQADGGNGVRTWDFIDSRYDENGDLAQREIHLDNGVVHFQEYTGGVIARSVLIDNPDNGGDGAKTWSMIDTQYDQIGKISTKYTVYDSGVERFDEFTEGVRARTIQVDNSGDGSAKTWESIDTYYSPTGEIETRTTTYDNGLVRYERFEDGVRSGSYVMDNPYDEGDGVKSWDSVATTYDASGVIESKITVYDDGRVRDSQYDDGTIAQTIIWDNPLDTNGGSQSWNVQEFIYDDEGSLESRKVEYDDGDLTYIEYVDGRIASRSYLDGDGDQTWLGRTVTYDAQGQVASNEIYNSIDELPAEFLNGLLEADVIG